MEYTPEKLRGEAVAVNRMHGETLTVEWRKWCADQLRAHADAIERADRLAAECERLRERLEIASATNGNGTRVPFPKGAPDGIACRDATIRNLEAECERLREEIAAYRRELDRFVPDVLDAIDAARGGP